jgi:hypothetical protein
MFNFISWQGYWTFLALACGLYYVVIYFLYFRPHLKLKSLSHSTDLPFAVGEEEKDMIYGCMEELNAFFEQSLKEQPVKEEMLYKLKRILRKYPQLKNPSYTKSLNYAIRNGFEKTIAIHLSEEDLLRVWLENE